MHRLRKQLANAVLWAMIPLTFVGGAPQIGCRCINGQYKRFCGLARGCKHVPSRGEPRMAMAEPVAGCPCCHTAVRGGQRSIDCQHQAAERRAADGRTSQASHIGLRDGQGRCCTPVVFAETFKAAAPVVVAELGLADAVVVPHAMASVDDSTTFRISLLGRQRSPLPGLDLTIVNQVFLI